MSRPLVVPASGLPPHHLDEAAALLRSGGLVALPTETVYGLGANALDPRAVERIFEVKGRPPDNPLIVHLAEAADLDDVGDATPLARRLAAAHWPGPLTLVVEAREHVPRIVTAGLPSVAVRVPAHPVARALIAAAGVPVAAPSANRSGRPSPTTARHVLDDLGDAVDAVVDGGPCPIGVESTVVDARADVPVVLRDGGVTREALGLAAPSAVTADLVASPGTRHRHYAPGCRVVLAPAGEGAARAAALLAEGLRVAVAGPDAPAGAVPIFAYDGAEELAPRLYGVLRDAEAAGVDVLVVEAVPEAGVGRAVMDRLRRAAAG